jgi:hypothetical protein
MKNNIVNNLFQLALLTEKELKGRQPTKKKTSFMPRPASMTHSKLLHFLELVPQ